MDSYAERKERKKERFQYLIDKKRKESSALYNEVITLLEVMPFGQPILVGHYSEKKHRNLLKKIDNKMRKLIKLDETVAYYNHKLDNTSNNISSDNPNAIEKLKEKLSLQQEQHEKLKCSQVKSYVLSNSSQRIRATKKRIEELEKSITKTRQDIIYDTWQVKYHDNRIQFIFNENPKEEIKKILKSSAFKWSPTRKAWVRIITNNAERSAGIVIKKLTEICA